MDKNEFVKKIYLLLTEENLDIYRSLLEKTKIENVTDKYWKNLIVFYNKLSESEKKFLLEIIRQIIVDTASNFFSILDGNSFLQGQPDNLFLSFEKHQEMKLNGNLQDIFLEFDEETYRG